MEQQNQDATPNISKPLEPPLPSVTFGDYFAQMTWDKNCKKPGCYGRGHIGVTIEEKDGKVIRRTINPCSCLHYNEEGRYIQIMKRIEKLAEDTGGQMEALVINQVSLFQYSQKKFTILENLSISVRLFRLYDRLFTKKRSANVKSGPVVRPLGDGSAGKPIDTQVPVSAPAIEPLTK